MGTLTVSFQTYWRLLVIEEGKLTPFCLFTASALFLLDMSEEETSHPIAIKWQIYGEYGKQNGEQKKSGLW